jgi:hypothetical protein
VGYSKYTEDIIDRHVEDTRDREDAFYRQWSIDHVPAPPPRPGEVHLELSGKRLEDEEVFPVGQPLKLRAIVTGNAAPIEIWLRRGTKESVLQSDAGGNYTIPVTRPESVEIDAASGAYHRRYVIHFVQVAQIDKIEGLATEITRFTSNPPGWTRQQFDDFRARLAELLCANSVPQSFGDGIVEYFFGVQFEANGDAAFSQRLETAFTMLKRFAPFSDIAALITEYFRYRTNTFAIQTSITNSHARPFRWIRDFFLREKTGHSSTRRAKRGIELVVPEVEYCCMEAVRAMVRDDEPAALGMASLSRKLSGNLIDGQREDRLRLIEARAYAEMGELSKARAGYQSLATSPCSLFQAEAVAFLKL